MSKNLKNDGKLSNDQHKKRYCFKNNIASKMSGQLKKILAKQTLKQKIYFDRRIPYEQYLTEFRKEFINRWKNVYVSLPIGLQGFTEVCVLGIGSFGSVKLLKKNNSDNMYATKFVSRRCLISAKHVAEIFNEKRVLSAIRFPFHTNLEFSRKDENYLYLGMTLAAGGELFEYHRRLGNFNEKQARFYAAQIFLALEYLHFMNLIYRDLKPENICFDENGYIKLTDYGFTKYVRKRTQTLCGTPEYLAPEVIKMQPYGVSADWWAFGVLLYEFVFGESPFSMHATKPMIMYEKICNGEYQMRSRFSTNFKDLVGRLLQPDLSKRIGVCNNGNIDIKKHKWFQHIDWYAILNQEVEPPFKPHKRNFQNYNKKSKISPRKSKKGPSSDVFKNF